MHPLFNPPHFQLTFKGLTSIGSLREYGGVRILRSSCDSSTYRRSLVIFQEPRHGPPLPEGEHYLTIGWKQVKLFVFNCVSLIRYPIDLACAQTIQETTVHLCIPVRILSVGRCTYQSVSFQGY
jgi:hypothetical protein